MLAKLGRKAKGRARQVERRGQGHYRGRSPCVRMYGAPATSAGTPRRLRAQEPRPGRLYSDTRLAGRASRARLSTPRPLTPLLSGTCLTSSGRPPLREMLATKGPGRHEGYPAPIGTRTAGL